MLEARLLTAVEMVKVYGIRLNELLVVVGSTRHLAAMLGVSTQNTNGWMHRGRISKTGARLVGNHPRLGKHFKAEYLRPDLALKNENNCN